MLVEDFQFKWKCKMLPWQLTKIFLSWIIEITKTKISISKYKYILKTNKITKAHDKITKTKFKMKTKNIKIKAHSKHINNSKITLVRLWCS